MSPGHIVMRAALYDAQELHGEPAKWYEAVTDLEVDDGPCRKMMMSNDDLTNLNTPLRVEYGTWICLRK